MAPIWSKQPLKSAYVAWTVIRSIITLLLSTRYAVQSLRHVKGWNYRTCLTRDLLRLSFDYTTTTRSSGLEAVKADQTKTKERFALAEPGDANLYTGVLASKTIKPTAVGGIWFPKNPTLEEKTLEDKRVVLHFPGGAFVIAFGYEKVGRDIADVFIEHMDVPYVFFAQYRPASDASSCFPAAVQDVLTAYKYILDLGFKSCNIIVSGDSAASNLNMALLRYLEGSPVLPLPVGIMSWSPWLHVTSKAGQDYNACANSQCDVLIPELLQWGCEAYPPPGGPSKEQLPYIDFLHHPFKTSVPLFFHAGNSEAFHDWVRDFAQEMAEMNGEQAVKFHSTNLAPHDLLLTHKGTRMIPEMKLAGEDARQFFMW